MTDTRPSAPAADRGLLSRSRRSALGVQWRWALVPLAAWVSLLALVPGTSLPLAWPVSGLLAGGMLGVTSRHGRAVLAVGTTGIAVAHLVQGVDPVLSVCFALACALEAVVVRRLLTPAGDTDTPALLDDGDVSRMIRAVALGAATGSAGYALALALAGEGDPLLALVVVWGTHAASLMVILPLFLRTPVFPPMAPRRERITQCVVALGTTAVVGLASDAPPLLFVVMPMFAWLGFRGTLREATWVLLGLGLLTTVITAAGTGPVAALVGRYDIAPELAAGFLQLVILDCGLILLPLSVSVALQRGAAAEAAAGRDTLQRLLASATATAIVATDAAGRIVVFNPGAEAMFGYEAGEVLGSMPDRFHCDAELQRLAEDLDTRPVFAELCAALAASESPRRLWTFVRKDGMTGTMLMTVAPLPEARGDGGFLCTAEDVTERERAQEALVATLAHREAAMERLEELDRIRTDFVATVSHELRTPITSILGYTELLQDSGFDEVSPGHARALERIARNSRRLQALIEDLLTASQVETSQLTATRQPCDVRGPVSDAIDAAADLVSGRDLAFEVVLPEDPVTCLCDADQIERLVLNLFTNAVKCTPDGGSIHVRLQPSAAGVELVVRDTGVGIPEDEQDRLFTRFFRSSTSMELAIQGTGLGLTIVHSIVELHDGRVGIVSAPGAGTTVTVWLPIAPATTPIPAATDEATHAAVAVIA